MNPSGQPQPGQNNQNNFPPRQPQPSGSYPPTPNGWQQPQGPAPNPWQQTPPPQQQWGQPAQYPQPNPQPGAIGPQPTGAPEYSADYLDQIAPGPGGPKFFSGSFTWIIVGLAIVFMFAVGIIALSSNRSNAATAEATYIQLDNLNGIMLTYSHYLKSSSILSTNSNFRIFVTGAEHDLIDPLTKNGVDMTKLDKTMKAKGRSDAAALTATLEDARLNVILDRVYAREMGYQAQLLLNNYTKMTKNQSKLIADNAKKAIANLQPLQKAFADYKDTTGN